MRQLGLAFHNYHDAYRQFPPVSGGTSPGSDAQQTLGNANRLSAFVGLTPFFEEQRVWEMIANPFRSGNVTYPPMGPVPWHSPQKYPPWSLRSTTLACPSDPDSAKKLQASSYVLNYGDAVVSVGAPMESLLKPYAIDRASKRGAFIRQKSLRIRDFLDGTSNTLLMSESKITVSKVGKEVPGLALNPSQCLIASDSPDQSFWPHGRNSCWADGSLRSIGFQTILPPNSPSATSDVGELEGVMSASSHHEGGIHVLLTDGAVRYIVDSIDAGDSTTPSVATPVNGEPYSRPGAESPYGAWGALGTRAAREIIDFGAPEFRDPPPEIDEKEQAQIRQIPIETWTRSDGTVVRGRLYQVVTNSRAIILLESGKSQSIDLSDLTSEDAYRAVERHLKRLAAANKEVLIYLEKIVGLLEQKKYDQFIKESFGSQFPAEVSEQMKADLVRRRGAYLLQLDDAIAGLRDGTAQVKRSDDGTKADIRTENGRVALRKVNGNWRMGN